MKNEAVFSCNLFLLIFLFGGLILAIFSFEAVKKNEIFLINILHNWNTKPFYSIKSFKGSCVAPYIPIKINKQISTCDNSDLIDAENAMDLNSNILSDTHNHVMCVLRWENFNYFNYLVEDSDVCNGSEKNCGFMDTLNNTLCLSKSSNCPINGLTIRKSVDKSVGRKNENKTIDHDSFLNKENPVIFDEQNKHIYINNNYYITHNSNDTAKDPFLTVDQSKNYIVVNIELLKGRFYVKARKP